MTYYSYPFNNLNIDKFWNCFDDIKTIEVMNIKSNAVINGKFSKAKCYYKIGRHTKKWRTIEPTNEEFIFQIGEHDNCHGHFINMDITDFLWRSKVSIPYQATTFWQAPSCVDADRKNMYILLPYNITIMIVGKSCGV